MALSTSISGVAGLSRCLTIASFIACLIVLLSAPAANAHFVAEGLAIEVEWVGLEARDAELVMRRPILVAKLTNREPVPIRVRLKVAVTIDGRTHAVRQPKIHIAPQETVLTRVRLPQRFANVYDLEFSGRVSTTAIAEPVRSHQRRDDAGVRHPDEGLGLPNLWFHIDRGSFRFYREDVMRNVYDGGNYRGTDLNVFDSSVEMEDAIALVTGRSNVSPFLAHVALGGGTSGGSDDLLPPGSRKFCLMMDGFAFVDSSRPWKEFGEDVGRAGSLIPLPRAWVALGQNGSGLYTGFLDSEGCTPHVVTNTSDPVSVAFIPMAHNPLGNRLFVSDLNLGAQWPNSMPFFLLFFDVVDAPVNFLEMDLEDFVQAMFAAAANCMERAPGGLTNALYEFQVRLASDNNGTETNYGDGGHPRVQVKFTPGAQSKFTLCHEYTHAMNIAELVPALPLDPTGLDYSVGGMEGEQHTLTSKEWNLAAAIEGFAHFVSATVWNDVSTGAEGVYVDGAATTGDSEPYPLDTFDQLFLDNYGAAGNLGQGVELDWAQFFWAWHTDNVEPQSVPTMIAIWYEAYQPWPVNTDFYAVFESAASSVLADQDELDRMIDLRIDAGIVP